MKTTSADDSMTMHSATLASGAAAGALNATKGSQEPLLLYAEKENLDPRTWRVEEHTHTHHELLVLERGHHNSRIDGKEVIAGPGEVLIYSAGSRHEESLLPDKSVVKYTIGFDWNVNMGDLPTRVFDGCGRIAELADWMTAEVPNKGDLSPPICEPLVYGLVGEIKRAAERSQQELKDKVRRVMQTQMHRILTVTDLAEALKMSRSHLSRRFAEETGSSPSDFLREERLRRARHLLRNTEMAVKEVAFAVGVSSEQQLCRMVRSSWGMTTRQLRGLAN